jgi:hypothetical protein
VPAMSISPEPTQTDCQHTGFPTIEQILAPFAPDVRGMENKQVLLRLLCLDRYRTVAADDMAANWRALAFLAVEGAAGIVKMLHEDEMEGSRSIERGDWDEPCRCCRREAYRFADDKRRVQSK